MSESATQPGGVVDLLRLAGNSGEGRPVWSERTEDLNLNLIVLEAGGEIPEHTNVEVEVLLVGIEGAGFVEIDGQTQSLRAGQAIVIPKGTKRSIHSSGDKFAYLSCHRRRAGLWPTGKTLRQSSRTENRSAL